MIVGEQHAYGAGAMLSLAGVLEPVTVRLAILQPAEAAAGRPPRPSPTIRPSRGD